MKGFLVRPAQALLMIWLVSLSMLSQAASDPLPSWKEGPSKKAIIEFVTQVTKPGAATFVPEPERIATFDNDGTLWAEQPVYFQGLFAVERVRALADKNPDWRKAEPYKSAIEGDMKGVMASGMEGLEKLLVASHANVEAEVFAQAVSDWLATAKHPTTGKHYTQMVYQPMLELLDYLRTNGFKTFIVSGGGIDFIRVFAEQSYGIPPEQVVGTTLGARFDMKDGVPTIVKEPKLVLMDDKVGKPVGIYQYIGRRPIMAVGNSDGDMQMLQYTTIARSEEDKTPRLGVIVHHTDAEREWAYDRTSHIGKLDKAMDESKPRGWVLVDMKKEWSQVFPE